MERARGGGEETKSTEEWAYHKEKCLRGGRA